MGFKEVILEKTSQLPGKPRTAGAIVFIFLLLIISLITMQKYQIIKENERQEMLSILNVVKQNIDQSLKNSYTAALTLALTLNDEGKPVNFEKIGAELVGSNVMLQAVELVPNGIIQYVYPLKGNEMVLGMDVFKATNQVAADALKTVEYKKMYFSGPIELRQGGKGIVGRIPLFREQKFWGFSAVVIKLDAFLEQAGIYNQRNKKFYFQFSKVSADGEVFYLPGKKEFNTHPYESIFFPDGDWKLYLIVTDRHAIFLQLISLIVLGLALATVCGLLTMKLVKKPAELMQLADRQTRDSQQRIGSLIDTIDGIVWEANPDNFEFTYISKKTEQILGYTAEEWMDSHTFWADHVHPDDKDWVVNYCLVCTKALQSHDFEYRMMAKDGSVVWLRDIVNVITDSERPVLLRGIMIDITGHKKAEQILNDSFNLVSEQHKRLINFSYIVSHNLRSHTSNIQAISELMGLSDSESETRELAGLLKRASASLNETLMNLNQVVNIQTSINLSTETLNLKEYLGKTIGTLNEQIVAKDAKVLVHDACDVGVNYNPAYLESVLLNFIYNAIRYSHPDRKPLVELTCFLENGQQVLQVSDNGIGLDLDKHRDELFGMYKTFSGNGSSKGMGLFIAKSQIDAMGGRVTVSSVLNSGTTFKIYFK
ncbi:PAS domain-containing protein [Pedobacter heparinus]|uniref:sensor histidine kinase n=1 Tax=Pedobacter heparinus TaxID=984 RepID=UPI00292F00B9|nr:PAS domain-containing protein [Pedobacter heparinus]